MSKKYIDTIFVGENPNFTFHNKITCSNIKCAIFFIVGDERAMLLVFVKQKSWPMAHIGAMPKRIYYERFAYTRGLRKRECMKMKLGRSHFK